MHRHGDAQVSDDVLPLLLDCPLSDPEIIVRVVRKFVRETA